jgi:hypothetical protein
VAAAADFKNLETTRSRLEAGMKRIIPMVMAFALTGVAAGEASASSLRGSRATMEQQNSVARAHDLTFYRTAEEIREGVRRGDLVELRGNEDYDVADFVRYPYAHPAALLFVERLSAQYREACGQKLVVTSAVRPTSGQPRNSHELSVHPAGMALDLRVSDRASCRSWLENALMNLERSGVLNGIREFHPPHYHVAVYPEQYLAYAAERMRAEESAVRASADAESEAGNAAVAGIAATVGVAADTPAPPRRRVPHAAAVVLLLAVPFGGGVLAARRRGSGRRSTD